MVRLVLADDHELVLVAFERLLGEEPDFEVVGTARTASEVLALVRATHPDIVLLDVAMPAASGLSVLPELTKLDGVAVILVTAGVDEEQRAEAFRSGARAIIEKGAPSQSLYEAIRTVASGGYWSDRAVRATANGAPLPPRLTRRELQVLRVILEGATNKDVAQKLHISEDTVKHHVTKLFDKTGASSRLELVTYAIRHGLVGG